MSNLSNHFSHQKVFILIALACLLQVTNLNAQTGLEFGYQKSVSGNVGNNYGIGLNHLISNTNVGINLSYVTYFGAPQRAGVEYDSFISSNGIGISIDASRFFSKENRKGLYYGIQMDFQYFKTTFSSFGRSSAPYWENELLLLGQFGYQIQLNDSAYLQLQVSSGTARTRRYWATLLGIKLLKQIN